MDECVRNKDTPIIKSNWNISVHITEQTPFYIPQYGLPSLNLHAIFSSNPPVGTDLIKEFIVLFS
jgi:hypothetical protein